jgi:SagB-type dehydrogenase family enzyme
MNNHSQDTRVNQVYAYHQRSKHQFNAYAKSPDFLDWSTQPDPFRRFAGAPLLPLVLAAHQQKASYAELFIPNHRPTQPATAETLAIILELSFGLSAWKEYEGERWALRCNPSSGNLHPTEAYAIVSGLPNLPPGVFHYLSNEHGLEQRCSVELPFEGILIGLSSVHWREAWKYGERAFRYCQHDVGHALGALCYAVKVLGWTVEILDTWGDDEIATLLGLDREADFVDAEMETPDLLCRIHPHQQNGSAPPDIDGLLQAIRNASWQGQANVLSPKHRHHWSVIEETSAATRKPRTRRTEKFISGEETLLPTGSELSATELIKQRRSAQAFDGTTWISIKAFFRILDATLPRFHQPPFETWPWSPRVHFLLFVHRVNDLPPGLYLFLRHPEAVKLFRRILKDDFLWNKVKECPAHFELYHLVRANAQNAAKTLSCHQNIAADSAFSLGMLAEFDLSLSESGPWAYRRLFWETGLIGQTLYLEAEAAGVRGTGIGCFFDDPVHQLIGLEDTLIQSLYHFTIGAPLTDQRLQTLPPYGHLQR